MYLKKCESNFSLQQNERSEQKYEEFTNEVSKFRSISKFPEKFAVRITSKHNFKYNKKQGYIYV